MNQYKINYQLHQKLLNDLEFFSWMLNVAVSPGSSLPLLFPVGSEIVKLVNSITGDCAFIVKKLFHSFVASLATIVKLQMC